MSRIAIIRENAVENVIAASLEFAQEVYPDAISVALEAGEACSPGDTYDPEQSPRFLSSQPEVIAWGAFRSQILINPAYLRIVTISPITQTLNTAMVGLLWRLGEQPELMGDVAQTWAAIASYAHPTAQEIAALNKIGDDCNMPFRISEQGLMEMRA